ncbi:MAG: formate dehydrogenase accessory sulfurtransferase FdhD, partial [Colwellia sp.]|nr:formate dehydrogenase accessory sulfurtransferase FdhD [Colwellia sp.]
MPFEQVNKIVYQSSSRTLVVDNVIIEQPLQIRLSWQDNASVQYSKVLTITMRTPGQDKVLILGLLLSEGIIQTIKDIEFLSLEKNEKDSNELSQDNLWEATLVKGIVPKISSVERYQVTYSSCGLCGATSLKALELNNPDQLCQKKAWLAVDDIYQMPDKMKVRQSDYIETGGAHGA